MAQTDFTEVTGPNANATSVVARGVSSGITRPAGGGNFVFAFNSLLTTQGIVAFWTNQANFGPTSAQKGMQVTAAMQRGTSGDTTGWSCWVFAGLQGVTSADSGYLFGL